MAVAKVARLQPLHSTEIPVHKRALVIGGGIAGMQTALDIADAGFKVTIVERETSLGGKMVMLDKTFPTMDCSACICTPKMSEVGNHPNITVKSYSEVESVSGYIGNFEVTIREKAKYIDYDKCTGCGACETKCPSKVDNEFEQGMSKRTAIYKMFPQAVPAKPVIDAAHCRKLQEGKCGVCAKVCPTGAIHKDDVGLTVVDSDKCTACGSCAKACPYNAITPAPKNTAASDLAGVKSLIKDCTADGKAIQEAVEADYPMHDPALDEYGLPLVSPGAALKCQMCKHLVYHGDLPRCVEACPAKARIFGDEEDIYGEIHQLKEMYEAEVLRPEAGTEPHVYYIREFHKTW
jgi:Fe-S-cluster-containing dehydrogenase component